MVLHFTRPTLMVWVVFLTLTATLSLSAQPKNALGAELSLSYAPSGVVDPYSGPMGVGLYYDRRNPLLGLSAGASASLTSYYPRSTDYGRSRMITWGVNAGCPVSLPLHTDTVLQIVPRVGLGFYHRWFEFEGSWLYASRPVLTLSVSADLVRTSGLVVGLGTSGAVFFDNSVRVTVGLGERIGVMF